MFDSKPNLAIFNPEKDIPDLSGKVFIVTGGNAGLGEAALKVIARYGAKVYMASRSEEKANAAIARLRSDPATANANVEYLPLDLASLHSIQTCAETFLRREPTGKLNVLINNAGIMLVPATSTTSDGFEAQLGTNYVGHYYLTELLLPALEKAAEVDGEARVVNLSSGAGWGSYWGWKVDEKTGRCGMSWSNYCQSKWANACHARMLARRYQNSDKNVKAYAVHPGMIMTDLYVPFSSVSVITNLAHRIAKTCLPLLDVPQGAHTALFAALSKGFNENDNGSFWIPGPKLGRKMAKIDDDGLMEEVESWTVRALKERGVDVKRWFREGSK